MSCKIHYKMHVGRLGVPAGGLRTCWTNGPSVFCIFEKGMEPQRRGQKRQNRGHWKVWKKKKKR